MANGVPFLAAIFFGGAVAVLASLLSVSVSFYSGKKCPAFSSFAVLSFTF